MHDTTNIHSHYKKLGRYIKPVDVRNKNLEVETLLGVSVQKVFIPSIANTVGTDFRKYKIVKNKQFTYIPDTSRRGDKIGIAMLEEHDIALVSQAYSVFEITNHDELEPEYLMMWFRRPEFDRYARYKSHGSVREIFDWEEMCEIELPIPSIEKQREIVKEYNTIVNRIKINGQLNQKLEETAQALYKHWFVDFEFPNEDGQPNKSSGGNMVNNEELDKEIPEGWEVKPFTSVVSLLGGGTPSTTNFDFWNGEIPFFTPKDIAKSYYTFTTEKYLTEIGLNNCSSRLYSTNTVFVTARGTVGAIGLAGKPMAMNQSCYAILGNHKIGQYFTHQLTIETIKSLKEEATGAVFKALVTRDFDGKAVIEPDKQILDLFERQVSSAYKCIEIKSSEHELLVEVKNLILAKMTKVES